MVDTDEGSADIRGESSSGSHEYRFGQYRTAGWWTGERLVDRFERHVSADPSRPAVIDDMGQSLSRAELWAEAGRFAQGLAGLAGPVVMLLPNTADAVVAFLGTLRASAVPATLPATSAVETVVAAAISVGAGAIVAPAASLAETVSEASEAMPHAVRVGVADNAVFTWGSAGGSGARRMPHESATHVMFTSGTTQAPKVVLHNDDTLGVVNEQCRQRFGLSDDPIFMAAPLGHSVGAVHGLRFGLYSGAPLVLQSRWDAEAAAGIMHEYGCVFTAAPMPFLSDLLAVPSSAHGARLPTVETFLCGGAPVSAQTIRRAREAFPNTFITAAWGMTEGGITTCLPASSDAKIETTVGVGLPGLELRTLDAGGGIADFDVEGELAMRGPGVFLGYAEQPDTDHSPFTPDGFFRTGDMAVIDEDGYLRITGRLKDLIIRGGVNISPIRIEDVLAEHPHVAEVAVVGYPDERLGERICAAIVLAPNAPPDLDLLGHCRRKGLPRRQWPEFVAVVDQLPRNAGGKVQKPLVRQLLADAPEPPTRLGPS